MKASERYKEIIEELQNETQRVLKEDRSAWISYKGGSIEMEAMIKLLDEIDIN